MKLYWRYKKDGKWTWKPVGKNAAVQKCGTILRTGGRRMNLTDELILEIIKKLSWISDLNREEEE